MEGIFTNGGAEAWVIEFDDWLKLQDSSEVYEDVKSGLLAGEKYHVKGNDGKLIGVINLNSSEELEIIN